MNEIKLVIYSYCTNNIHHKPFPEIRFPHPNITYVMFTDDIAYEGEVRDGWSLREAFPKNKKYVVHEDENKNIKWHPFNYFKASDFDYSLYIDSKVEFIGDPMLLVNDLCGKMKYGFCMHEYDFGKRAHNEVMRINSNNIFNHIDYLISVKAGIASNLNIYKKFLKTIPIPKAHFAETAVILTDLKSQKAKEIQTHIFDEYFLTGTRRDQIVIPYICFVDDLCIDDLLIMGKYSESSFFKNNSSTNVNNRIYFRKNINIDKQDYSSDNIIVLMTSWTGRINLAKSAIDQLKNQTRPPNHVYLTLAIEEFQNKEKNLPCDLVNIAKNEPEFFTINWVDQNTFSMKKVIPVLPYLKDDDIIITLDEDILIPPEFIESRYEDFLSFGKQRPISSNKRPTVNYTCCGISCTSVFTKRMVNGIEKLVDIDILKTKNDDRLTFYALLLNGYIPKPCRKFSFNLYDRFHLKQYSEYNGMSSRRLYIAGAEFDKIILPKIFKNFHVSFKKNGEIEKSNQTDADKKLIPEIKIDPDVDENKVDKPKVIEDNHKINEESNHYDILYISGTKGRFNNQELKISISSMIRYCGDWINKIYIIGKDPKIKNPLVSTLPCHDIYTNNDANIIYKIKTAVTKIPTLSDDFLVCFDNQVVTHPMKFSDFKPKAIRLFNPVTPYFKAFKKSKNEWNQQAFKTMMRFWEAEKTPEENQIYFYHPYSICSFNKVKFIELINSIENLSGNDNIVFHSLYFNKFKPENADILKESDILDCVTKPTEYISYVLHPMYKLPDIICYDDKAFRTSAFRTFLLKVIDG